MLPVSKVKILDARGRIFATRVAVMRHLCNDLICVSKKTPSMSFVHIANSVGSIKISRLI